LAVAWIVCLDALPALGSHAPAIDSLRDLVFGLGLLNTLAAVGVEVEDTPGDGQMCDACGVNITSDQIAMGGTTLEGGRRTRHFHALCFRIWDNESHLLDKRSA
jgi:hypothetical protein